MFGVPEFPGVAEEVKETCSYEGSVPRQNPDFKWGVGRCERWQPSKEKKRLQKLIWIKTWGLNKKNKKKRGVLEGRQEHRDTEEADLVKDRERECIVSQDKQRSSWARLSIHISSWGGWGRKALSSRVPWARERVQVQNELCRRNFN